MYVLQQKNIYVFNSFNYFIQNAVQKSFILENMFQTFCTPAGNECYQQMSPPASSCSTPCHGVYADVDHVQGALYPGEGTDQFQGALAEYQRFKNGGEKEVKYPVSLTGK